MSTTGITSAAFARDQNRVPITQTGLSTTDAQTLTASGATADVPLFTISGSILVNALYGVVTTDLGNCTAAYWRLNDGSNTPAITLATGTALTNAAAGSTIVKKALAATALTLLNNSASVVSEPAAAEGNYFSPFVVQSITGGTTNLEFVYTTSDAPTTGAITFYLGWIPLTADSSVTAL